MAESAPSFIAKGPSPVRTRIFYEGGAWLFNIGLVLFIAAAVLAGGLFFYQRSLGATRAQWAEQVAGQEAELRPELLGQLVDLSNSLSVGRELIQNHVFASNALFFVQAISHPFVQFATFAFSRDARKIELSGQARSYQTVGEQIRFVESHPQVEKVEFGGLALGERGLVNFRLAIIFKPTLLQLRSQ